MSAKGSPRAPVTFHDVAVYFSEDEWVFLEEWRKELYKNVMREIHGALISMGYAIVNPDTLFRIKKEEKPFVSNPPACKKRESFQGPISGSSVLGPDILLRIKQEEEPVLYHLPVVKKRESILNSTPHQSSETSIISVRIKEEEDAYPLEPQLLERTESFNSPATKDESTKRIEIPSEEFNKERNQKESTLVKSREKPAHYAYKRMHCERNQNSRGTQGILPGYKPERNLEFERSFHHLTNPMVQQIIHGGEMPYTCFEFIDERWTHKERRIYYCNECGRGFWKLYCFKVHQRTHTGEKPYTCNECEKSFSQSSNLIRHQKIHTGDKPYRCTECNKSFSQSSTLAKHQNTHIGVGEQMF